MRVKSQFESAYPRRQRSLNSVNILTAQTMPAANEPTTRISTIIWVEGIILLALMEPHAPGCFLRQQSPRYEKLSGGLKPVRGPLTPTMDPPVI